MKIAINCGHTKVGAGTGAVGNGLKESIETRKIGYELMKLLVDTRHEVIPVVIDSSSNNLKEAVQIANSKKADVFLSIHLNAGGGTGCEAYTWKAEQLPLAVRICDKLNTLGFRNRGIKDGGHLYVVKKTKCPSVLLEVFFIDNTNDVHNYTSSSIAKLIYKSIVEVYGK